MSVKFDILFKSIRLNIKILNPQGDLSLAKVLLLLFLRHLASDFEQTGITVFFFSIFYAKSIKKITCGLEN